MSQEFKHLVQLKQDEQGFFIETTNNNNDL